MQSFSSNPNQTHLKYLINVNKITRKLQTGVFDFCNYFKYHILYLFSWHFITVQVFCENIRKELNIIIAFKNTENDKKKNKSYLILYNAF